MKRHTERAARKLERRRSKPQRMRRLKAHYARLKAAGKFRLQWAVIECHWRQSFTIQETAEVLGISEDDAQFEIDIAIQNAQ